MKKRLLLLCLFMLLVVQTAVASEVKVEFEEKDYDGKDIETLVDFIDYYYAGDEVSKNTLYEAAIRGIFDQLDKYSVYYTPEEYAEFIEGVSGQFAGIGAYIHDDDEGIMIVEPIKGSPAEKAGLLAGDIVTAVDGISLTEVSYDEGVDAIKGEPGTKVKLAIKRGVKTFHVVVTRDVIQVSAVSATPLLELYPEETDQDAQNIWYVDIDSFNATVADDFEKVITDAQSENVKGLIIDLRNNLGGYLDQVVEMCQRMVPEGNVLSTRDKLGNLTLYFSDEEKTPFKLVILTNELTASASEIFASCIQDARVGILIGEQTYGKGVVQRIIKLEDGLQFKMTMSEYFTRDGHKINGVGVKPDIEVIIPEYLEDTNKTYLLDSKGEEVKKIEDILVYLGYLDGADDVYDAQTVGAVLEFQKNNSLAKTGVCDYFTMGLLNERLQDSVKENDPQMDMAIKIMYSMIY